MALKEPNMNNPWCMQPGVALRSNYLSSEGAEYTYIKPFQGLQSVGWLYPGLHPGLFIFSHFVAYN